MYLAIPARGHKGSFQHLNYPRFPATLFIDSNYLRKSPTIPPNALHETVRNGIANTKREEANGSLGHCSSLLNELQCPFGVPDLAIGK
jgi:hypothetical protein